MLFLKWISIVLMSLLISTNAVYSATTHHAPHKSKKHLVAHHTKKHHAMKKAHHQIRSHHEPGEEKVKLTSSIPAYILKTPEPEMHLFDSVKKPLVTFVDKIVSTIQYSSYKMGGKHFDPKNGVYIVDCSNFVDHILENTCPNAYASLVDATGADRPSTQHYYHFFNDLAYDRDHYWNRVENVDQLRPGDILVIRYRNGRGFETGGHVMVVMNQPIRSTDVYYVRVADSASAGHSDDTREKSGVGIGTLLLKANKVGRPTAYAWGVGGYWKRRVSFAMARPVEKPNGFSNSDVAIG